jgi:hypothetical protein
MSKDYDDPYLRGKNLWIMLISEAQADMDWTYTREEVDEYIKNKINEKRSKHRS